MGKKLQVSASHSDQLLQCGYAFGLEEVPSDEEPDEPALYGLAFHDVMAKMTSSKKIPTKKQVGEWVAEACAKFSVGHCVDELREHVLQAMPVLAKFLSGENAFRLPFAVFSVEEAYAYDVFTGEARRCKPFDPATHVYPDVRFGEVPGTVDLAATTNKHKAIWQGRETRVRALLVLDDKTGEQDWGSGDFSRPSTLAQIRTLALAVSGAEYDYTVPCYGAILHAPRRGMPKVYCDELDADLLAKHRTQLRDAYKRIGDGSMRLGPCCKHCDARTVCPAGSAEILAQAQTVVEQAGAIIVRDKDNLATPAKVGQLHMVIQEAERLIKAARPALRGWVRAHPDELAVRPDGKPLIIEPREVERMSKEDFVEAYGKLEAERMFAKFRKDGALVKKTEERLVATKAE